MMNRNIETKSTEKEGRLNADIYSVIEAVNASIAPGEEALVPYIVKHIIETCHAEEVRC